MTYPPLPICPPQSQGETLPEYASRVLRHLLATDCTATLSDEQLAQADTAAQRACSQLRGEDSKPSRLDAAQLLTLQTLSAARHTIAMCQRHRTLLEAQRQAQAQHQAAPAAQPAMNGGQRSPLQPPPSRMPPGGGYALPVPRVADGIKF